MPGSHYRHPITIQHKVLAVDKAGEIVTDDEGKATATWGTFFTARAAIEDLRGREFFEAAAVNSEITTRVRIRYQKGITAEMRIAADRTYDIIAVIDPSGRRRELHLMCKVVSGGG